MGSHLGDKAEKTKPVALTMVVGALGLHSMVYTRQFKATAIIRRARSSSERGAELDKQKNNDNASVELLRQNWEDYRHNERKRLMFAQLHLLVTVGILAFLVPLLENDTSVKSDTKWLIGSILVFLSVVSLWCLLNTLRIGACISASLHRCKEIIKLSKVTFRRDYWSEEKHWTHRMRERRLFLVYYIFSFLLFVSLLIKFLMS